MLSVLIFRAMLFNFILQYRILGGPKGIHIEMYIQKHISNVKNQPRIPAFVLSHIKSKKSRNYGVMRL